MYRYTAEENARDVEGTQTDAFPDEAIVSRSPRRATPAGSEKGIFVGSGKDAPTPAMSLDQALDAQMGLLPDMSQSPGASLPPAAITLTVLPSAAGGTKDAPAPGAGRPVMGSATPQTTGQQMQKVAPQTTGQQTSPAVKTMKATQGLVPTQ